MTARLLAALALFAAVAGGLAWYRAQILSGYEARILTEKAARREAIATHVVESAAAVQALQEQLRLERSRIGLHTETIIKGAGNYVSKLADSRCSVNTGFVLMHDDAATGRVPAIPEPAGGIADQPAGVSLSTVGAVVAKNYGACRELAAEVAAWRKWYPGAKARYEAVTGADDRKPGGLSQQAKGR